MYGRLAYVGKTFNRFADYGLRIAQNEFGGRAVPEPAGGAIALPRPLSSSTWIFVQGPRVPTLCLKKNKTPNSCPLLPEMLTDFQNSFTGRLTGKFATNSY